MASDEDRELEHELHRYRQRDLVPSHLYRLGKKLFTTEPVRRRVIDAARYVPADRKLVPHATNLRRTWDGRPLESVHPESHPPLPRRHSDQNLNYVKSSDFTKREYRQWMDERKKTRDDLESMAISETWLSTKSRSLLENKLYCELREKRRAEIAATSQIQTTTEGKISMPLHSTVTSGRISRQKSLIRSQKSTLAAAKTLSSLILLHGRQRFVSLLTLYDPAGTGVMTPELLETILLKMCPFISQESMESIMRGLPVNDHGLIEYHTLLRGGLLQCVEEYFEKEISDLVAAIPTTSTSEMKDELPSLDTTQSTMTGERGELSYAHKKEEEKRFEVLVEFCKERGIVLDRQLLERALLLPHDHSRSSCLASLRQPGLELQSRRCLIPRGRAQLVEREDYGKKFGWPYKELRGKRKPAIMRILQPPKQDTSSKSDFVKKAVLRKVAVAPKVDCWLTFKEYKWLTREITSRPGFNYIYHGLADNNVFWPGVLIDKLRLWLPSQTLENKPYSLYNIFQPVTHPRIYNPHAPDMEQRQGWPENERGYIQFGGDNRKTYAV